MQYARDVLGGPFNMADNGMIAAHLAAALIQADRPKLFENANGTAAETAVAMYYDCLDALRAEGLKRHAPKPRRLGRRRVGA
jgi:hypothetical protein